jgi:hypothetical protein
VNNKVEVSALILTIGDQEIKLTLAQARELLSALRNALEPAQKPIKRQTITDFDDLLNLKRQHAVSAEDAMQKAQDALGKGWTMNEGELRLVIGEDHAMFRKIDESVLKAYRALLSDADPDDIEAD